MDPSELAEKFVQVKSDGDDVRIEVAVVTWEGVHSPVTKWEVARSLPAGTPDEAVDGKISKVLEDRRYFGHCLKCGGWMQAGFMQGHDICQPCAEKYDGIVH